MPNYSLAVIIHHRCIIWKPKPRGKCCTWAACKVWYDLLFLFILFSGKKKLF